MILIYPWIDFIWLIPALVIAHKGQRLVALGFFLSCFFMMRLQVEFMASIGFPTGALPIIDTPLFLRGLITYGVFYALYLALAYWSPRSNPHVFLAGSISIFFSALLISTGIMLL